MHNGPDFQPPPDRVRHEGYAARPADQIDAGEITRCHVSVLESALQRVDGGADIGCDQAFELRSCQLDGTFQPWDPELACRYLAQGFFRSSDL
jgi:hypothetical protein